MSFIPQHTARQEVRAGTAGPVRVYLDTQVASATYRVLLPDNTEVQASGAATVVDLGEPPRSRIDCTVPSDLALYEDYEVEVTAGGVVYHEQFDVVARTLGPSPSLNDILQVRTQAHAALEQQAHVLGVAVETYVEAVIADTARRKLQNLIQQHLPEEPGISKRRPYAILDTGKLHAVETLLAVHVIYSAIKGGGEESESRQLAKDYWDEAVAEMKAMGPIRIDIDGDGDADWRRVPRGGTYLVQRVQG